MSVKLSEVVENLQSINDEIRIYYDKVVSEFILTGDYYDDFYTEEELEGFYYDDRYVGFCDSYDIDSDELREAFINTLPEQIGNVFEDAFSGRGAYGRFKQCLSRFKLWDEFNDYELGYFKYIGISWWQKNEVDYVDDMPDVKVIES